MKLANIASLILCAGISTNCSNEEHFSETKCEVRDNSVMIWMSDPSSGADEIGISGIQFEKAGLLIRLPPMHFAPDWNDVTLVLTYLEEDANNGELVVVGSTYEKPIGTVGRDCWTKVKTFIREKKIIARIRERTLNQ